MSNFPRPASSAPVCFDTSHGHDSSFAASECGIAQANAIEAARRVKLSPAQAKMLRGYAAGNKYVAGRDATLRILRDRGMVELNREHGTYYVPTAAGRAWINANTEPTPAPLDIPAAVREYIEAEWRGAALVMSAKRGEITAALLAADPELSNTAATFRFHNLVAEMRGNGEISPDTLARTASFMPCPRGCGIDVRSHHSSGSVNGGCDTGPMSMADMHDWFAARGVGQPGSLPMADAIAEHYGKTEDELNEVYDAMHGPIA